MECLQYGEAIYAAVYALVIRLPIIGNFQFGYKLASII